MFNCFKQVFIIGYKAFLSTFIDFIFSVLITIYPILDHIIKVNFQR